MGVAMVTIQSMEVRFEVEGDGDEQAFARLFERHIRSWASHEHARKLREKRNKTERSLGDGAGDADGEH
jgi:hypothetical protein